MNKNTIISATAAILLLCGCAREVQKGLNDGNKRYFDAWLQKNHPELVGKQQFPGFYVINETAGSGPSLFLPELYPYFRANYRITGLDGSISSSTFEQDAYKLRIHSDVAFYGPQIFMRGNDALYSGVEYAIRDMNVGGTREFILPGWLLTYDRFNTEQEYLDNVSGTDAIYYIEMVEAITDIAKWESDSVFRYVSAKFPGYSSDTVGFYKYTRKYPEKSFDKDTTFYINYIGRRLDGKVFDTNIADTAKFYGIWSSSGSYSPTLINWKKKYSDITMTSSGTSVIPGFSLLLSKMGDREKAVGVFTSEYGYSYSGSGTNIPGFCPLQFEVEIVDKEN